MQIPSRALWQAPWQMAESDFGERNRAKTPRLSP